MRDRECARVMCNHRSTGVTASHAKQRAPSPAERFAERNACRLPPDATRRHWLDALLRSLHAGRAGAIRSGAVEVEGRGERAGEGAARRRRRSRAPPLELAAEHRADDAPIGPVRASTRHRVTSQMSRCRYPYCHIDGIFHDWCNGRARAGPGARARTALRRGVA